MKFVFFSHGITKKLADKFIDFVGKKPSAVSLVYITTPANVYPPNPDWLVQTKRELTDMGFNIQEFDLEKAYKEGVSLIEYFKDKDVIFISGGNVFYLIYWMRETGFDKVLKDLIKNGVIYAGESAGTVCHIKDLTPLALIDEPEKAPEIINQGLQLTEVIAIPHWGNLKYQEKLEEIKKYYEDKRLKVHIIRDNEALFIEDGKIEKVVLNIKNYELSKHKPKPTKLQLYL